MNLYLLYHSRAVDELSFDTKIIGFFSSRDYANEILNEYKNIEGFKNYADDFKLEEMQVLDYDETKASEISEIYFLQHEYSDGAFDYVTDLGIFASYENAEKYAKENEVDFRQEHYEGLYPPNGFCISEYKVNQCDWQEGFIETEGT